MRTRAQRMFVDIDRTFRLRVLRLRDAEAKIIRRDAPGVEVFREFSSDRPLRRARQHYAINNEKISRAQSE